MSIQTFHEINDSHAATGYDGCTDIPTFHIFTIEDTYPSTRQVMPPYRFRFYQIVFLENSPDARLSMNTTAVDDLSDSLTFASPDHVLAWMRGEAQQGFIVYFKEEFLKHHPMRIEDGFPYFRLTEINLTRVQPEDRQRLQGHFHKLLEVFQRQQPYRVEILQALLLALLFECKGLYEYQQQNVKHIPARQALASRFQQFVNQHFLTRKTVEAYADLLAVSPDYLNQTVKVATGKTAHGLIAERILLEAKKLLVYSDLNVAEIADYLGFSEPTHFGRFFRRYVGLSPLSWRQQQ
jgi:AraC family transcriptional regulator, transcriptional activator of pobA